VRIRLVQPPLVQPRYRQLTLPVVGAEFAAHGLEVEACDENVEDLDLSAVDLVGITCHVYNAPRSFEIARAFRARGAKVILGGTFPTVAPDLVAPHCDAVVVGELEGQTARIVRDARAGRLERVYRASAPPSLESTPRPDLSLTPADRYLRFNFPLEVSRGCRFSCRFCTARTLYPSVRSRALADVERDLDRYDHGLVELLDVNFLAAPATLDDLLEVLRAAPVPGWTGQTTVLDLAADPSLPERLAESRCRAVFVGLESISAEGLRSLDKGWSSPAAFLEVARRLRDAGVLVQVGLVVGLDSDTPETYARTADFLDEARVQTLVPSWLHYYPGTPEWEALRAEGRLLTEDWRDLDGNRPVVRPLGMSPADAEREVAKLRRRFYGLRSTWLRLAHAGVARSPGQLVHHLVQNGVMRVYYGMVEDAAARGERAVDRYMGGRRREDRVERLAADATAWVLDRIFS
jgi:radical SAM superfamily enzyme YgiQ (UPF0313 family)